MRCKHILVQLCAMGCLGVVSCGPGWEGYVDDYSVPGEVETEPWTGEEQVTVVLDDQQVVVVLAGMNTYDFMGASAVSLSDLILKSELTEDPESFRYDFTASDSYNLLIKRGGDVGLLPGWDEIQGGFLYLDYRANDLTLGWTEHTWGSALSAYLVKYMDTGRIILIPSE